MGKPMIPMIDKRDDMTNASGANLIDGVIAALELKNDAALARAAQIAPPILSKVRNGRLPITASVLLRLHDATGIPVAELRGMARGE